jgi:hypothetical protein
MVKKNGKSFEKLVAIVQEAYKDSLDTKIYLNHRVRDRLLKSKLREFDIFITTKINNYTFNIAIECKDYKAPVSVEKIEAFNSKCSTVKDINKKIIISPKGFQSGALENAKYFDIELYTLQSVDKYIVEKWLDIESFKKVYGHHRLKEFWSVLDDKNKAYIYAALPETKVFLEDGTDTNLGTVVVNNLNHDDEFIGQQIVQATYKLDFSKLPNNFKIYYPHTITWEDDVMWVENTSGDRIVLRGIICTIESDVTVDFPTHVDIREYNKVDSDNELGANMITASFLDNSKLNVVKTGDSEAVTAYLIDVNQNIVKLKTDVAIDDQTGLATYLNSM